MIKIDYLGDILTGIIGMSTQTTVNFVLSSVLTDNNISLMFNAIIAIATIIKLFYRKKRKKVRKY